MPFGLMNAPAMFQHMDLNLFEDLPVLRVFIEDWIAWSTSFGDHIDQKFHVCDQVIGVGLKFELPKCAFGQTEISVWAMLYI